MSPARRTGGDLPADVVPRLGLLMMAAGFMGLFGMFPAIVSLGLMASGAVVIALAVLRFVFS